MEITYSGIFVPEVASALKLYRQQEIASLEKEIDRHFIELRRLVYELQLLKIKEK